MLGQSISGLLKKINLGWNINLSERLYRCGICGRFSLTITEGGYYLHQGTGQFDAQPCAK
jgi:hypothetical protein